MSDLDAFRAEIRAWLEENCPPEMREPVRDEADVCWGGRKFKFKNEAQKQWLERCAAKGYTVPDWPKPYGGAGMSPAEAKIWREEMHRIGARRTPNPQASPLRTLVMEQWRTLRRARQYRRWAARQAD